MQVSVYLSCLALLAALQGRALGVKVSHKDDQALQSEKPSELVKETEKAVKEVDHVRDITDKMNKYLASNAVDAGKFCESGLTTCKSIVDRYVSRCKAGDCYTLDSVRVFSVPGKFEVKLPHLAQFEMAKFVFKECGARNDLGSRFKDLFKSKSNKHPRSLSKFTSKLLKTNLVGLGLTDHSNFLLLNEVFYASTIYYQKYLNSTFGMSATHNRNAFTRIFFRLKHRGELIRMVRDLVGDKAIGVSHSDLKSLTDAFVLYLTVGNYRPRFNVANTVGKLVKHALAKTMGYRKVSFLMADFLLKFPVNLNDYCKASAQASCKDQLSDYLSRCDDGDCTSFDMVDLLDPKDWLNVKLPCLPQVSAAYDLFSGSRARLPNWFKRVFFNQWNRLNPSQFRDLLYDRNVSTISFKSKWQGYLHRFLAKSAFEFVFRSRGAKVTQTLSNSSGALNTFYTKMLGHDKMTLPLARVRTVFLQFRNYLAGSGIKVRVEEVNKFAGDSQHVFFTHLEDPFKGEYNAEHAKEWEKMVEKERKKKEQEESKPEGPEREKSFKNLWGLIPESKDEEKKPLLEDHKAEQEKVLGDLRALQDELDRTRAQYEQVRAERNAV